MNRVRHENGEALINFGGCCASASPEALEINQSVSNLSGVPLEFEIELLQVLEPNTYTREPWEMDHTEKYLEAPKSNAEGSLLFKKGDYTAALEKYERAMILLDTLSSSGIVLDLKKERLDYIRDEKKNVKSTEKSLIPDTNVIDLDVIESLMQSCRLNQAACHIKLCNFKSAIEQCSQVLKTDPKNVKALFRRAQAYCRIGRDLDLAEADFNLLSELVAFETPEWKQLIQEKAVLSKKLKTHETKEKGMYGGMFQKN